MSWREDKTLIVINFWLFVFMLVVIFVVFMKPDDGQLYTLFAGAFGSMMGALIMLLKLDKPSPPGSTTVTKVDQIVNVPPEEKDNV